MASIYPCSGALLERPFALNLQRRLGVNLIYSLGQELEKSAPYRAFWERLAQYAATLTQAPFAQILTLDATGGYICKAVYSLPVIYTGSFPNPGPARFFYEEARRRGVALLVKRYDRGINRVRAQALGLDRVGMIWLIPLKVGSETVGLLSLGEGSPDKIYRETPEDGNSRLGLMAAIADLIASAIYRARTHDRLDEIYLDVLIGLAKALDGNDPFMEHHADRTALMVREIAGQLGYSKGGLSALRWAALLHDIGKIAVPEEILSKPGPLNSEEWAVIRAHPALGAEFIAPVASLAGVGPLIRAHHERYDGSGYPDRLKAGAIPLGSRILAVADAYTCLTDGRPYRRAYTREEAAAELARCRGTQFDPVVIQAFQALFDQGRIQGGVNSGCSA